jgi:hypothetical protein
MAHISDDTPTTLLRISRADLDAAREAVAHDQPIRSAALVPHATATHAPTLPTSLRLASFQADLEAAIRSSVARGARAETVEALLAVAVHLSRRFPELQ